MSKFIYKDNILFCENVAVTDIVKEVGTPAYVYSKKTLLDNFESYSNAFEKNDGLVCFSVKSLSNISVLRLLKYKGSGFDIVSGGELERVLAAGVDPKKIIFTGIAKSNEEIIQGIRKNILSFNIESEAEMLRIEKLATDENKIVDVAIRFNPEIDSGGHEYIKTGRKKDKFGVLLEGVISLSKYILSSSSLNLIGLSCHIGSQIFELNDFEESAKYIKKLTPRIAKTVRNNFKHFLSWVIAPDTTVNLLTLPFELDRLGIWLTMLEKLPCSLWLTYDRRREHALAAVYPAVRPPVQTVEHLVPVANAPPCQPHLDVINISFVVFVAIWNE